MAYNPDQATVAALAAKNDYVIIPFGNSTEQVWTLDTYLSQWAAGAITEPAALGGADPVSEAYAVAADRCASVSTPDCAQAGQLAQQYGQAVANALAAGGYTGAPAAPAIAPAPAAIAPPVSAPAPTPSGAGAATPAFRPAAPVSPVPAPSAAADVIPASQFHPHFLESAGGGAGGTVTAIGLASANPILFGVGLAISVISSIFGSIFGSNDVQKLAKAVDQLKQATEQGLDQTTRFTWATANGLAALDRANNSIWDNFLDQLWSVFKNLWKLLWCLAATVIPKLIEAVKKLRKCLDWLYQHYIRKIMNYLQMIRRVLVILRVLGVPFAAKLDRIVGQIQSAVFGPFLYVLRLLNVYGSWVNLMLTNNLTIQKPVFLNSMYEYQADWINMFWEAQSNPHDPAVLALAAGAYAIQTDYFTAAGPNPASQTPPPATRVNGWDACLAFAQWVTTGSGPIQQDVDNGLLVFVETIL